MDELRESDKKFAVLIDADNISSKYIKTVFDEMAGEGIVTYKRIYGDWTSPNLKPWKEVLLEYSLTPIQQYAYTTGKNSTDSAMIIDAMDILYGGTVTGFCLVSSDSDFTKLAARLREAGKTVIGMGKQNTPKPFVVACNKFKYLDILSEDASKVKAEKKAVKSVNFSAEDSSQTTRKDIKNAITKLIEEQSDDEGWMYVSALGGLLVKKYSDFDTRNYGFNKMIPLLEDLGFEIKTVRDAKNKENNGGTSFVRIPVNPSPAKTAKKKK